MIEDNIERLRQDLSATLDADDNDAILEILDGINVAEISSLLDSLPSQQRDLLWPLIDPLLLGAVLLETGDEVRDNILRELSPREIATIIETLPDVDDQADIILSLPTEKLVNILHTLDAQKRKKLESVLSYSDDTAGGLMNIDQITIRADVTLDVVLRYLRIRGEMPDHTDQLFVTDRHDHYLGSLYLRDLLTNDPEVLVKNIMRTDVSAMHAHLADTEVAREFENYDLVSAPIVDEQHKLIGRITIDDVVDVIRDESEHSIMSMAGLAGEEDMFSPALVSAKRRGLWLGINLLTAFLAAGAIGIFEDILDQVVALAILLTIVPSMGGIAGSQTLTLVIRGIALGQLGSSNYRSLIKKEISIGILNGLVWALVVATFSVFWFENYSIGAIIGFALLVNLITGAFAGAVIPILLRQFGIDPAIAGGVVLTTVTDVVGIIAFLGLATLVLG
ncbi:MAG: magnesium transporter [Gammaproteobacteria bacterium]|nr:magnesium transporter [Gammaproteobacteria bacterium]MCZ6797447.1 magnesium transporter [Gammaproteobacteria bacterium]